MHSGLSAKGWIEMEFGSIIQREKIIHSVWLDNLASLRQLKEIETLRSQMNTERGGIL